MMSLSLKNQLLLLVVGGVLAVGVSLALMPVRKAFYFEPIRPLVDWLPKSVDGWSFEDMPVAATQEVAKAVGELLNFSDGIYRVYRSGNKEIKVYVAYWEPGKMDPRLVGVHSPDVCWVGAGWKLVGEKRRRSLLGTERHALNNGHDRVFENNGHTEAVVFWHLFGGVGSRYLEVGGPGAGWWTAEEVFRNPLAPRYEQFFIRISTPGGFDGLEASPMMKRIVDTLSSAAKS
jgi:hypothetical protein